MITNHFLPWKSSHMRLTEGDIVHAPTKRCLMCKSCNDLQELVHVLTTIFVSAM